MTEPTQAMCSGVSVFDIPLLCCASLHLSCRIVAKLIPPDIETEVTRYKAWLNERVSAISLDQPGSSA
jgi:hypothetical protein